jgi:hypothetical protein
MPDLAILVLFSLVRIASGVPRAAHTADFSKGLIFLGYFVVSSGAFAPVAERDESAVKILPGRQKILPAAGDPGSLSER